MESSKSSKDLVVWQKAHQFVLLVYAYSKEFPKEEIFGLTSQFRRAAIRMFNIAQGSLEECRYYVILSRDLGYVENVQLTSLSEEVSKLLNSYMNAIEKL